MTTTTEQTAAGSSGDESRLKSEGLYTRTLPAYFTPVLLAACMIVVAGLFALFGAFHPVPVGMVGAIVFLVAVTAVSAAVENRRRAADRLVTGIVYCCFAVAIVPLLSLLTTVVVNGLERFDWYFLTVSMNGVIPSMDAGGVNHAIVGTLVITAIATVISVPVGLMTAIYIVEYGRGRLKKAITFFVDVMTGIPSIVAGLFVVALWILLFGPGQTNGLAGAISLSVLMIPVVVRSSEEMLRLVPTELREASYALGVPKWLTIVKVVLPTAVAGLTTGIILALARVIGETAPLILTAGMASTRIQSNPVEGDMMSLPVFIYKGVRDMGLSGQAGVYAEERAWAAALVLILLVMALFLTARLVSHFLSPKTRG